MPPKPSEFFTICTSRTALHRRAHTAEAGVPASDKIGFTITPRLRRRITRPHNRFYLWINTSWICQIITLDSSTMDNAGLFNGLFRGGLFHSCTKTVIPKSNGIFQYHWTWLPLVPDIYRNYHLYLPWWLCLFYETMNVKEDTGSNCKRRLILYCFFNVLNEHHIHLFILKIHCYASSE